MDELYQELKLLQIEKAFIDDKIEKCRVKLKQVMLDAELKFLKWSDGGQVVIKEKHKTSFDEDSAINFCKEKGVYEMFTKFNPTAFKKSYKDMFIKDEGVELELAITIPDRELSIF